MLIRCTCGKPLRVKDELAGRKIRCPVCQAVVAVPGMPLDSPKAAAPGSAPRPSKPQRQEADVDDRTASRSAERTAPTRQVVLRSMVLVFAILGSGLAGFLGFTAYRNTHDPAQINSVELLRRMIAEREKTNPSGRELEELRAEVSRFDRLRPVSFILLAALLFGLAGGVLAFLRRGKMAAGLMLLPVAGAGAMAPPTLVLTSPLTLAAILALFVKSTGSKSASRSTGEEFEPPRRRPARHREGSLTED